jgi:homogentisate 1,2-dioxygenase
MLQMTHQCSTFGGYHMSIMQKRGEIDPVPHTEQRNADGSLRLEEIHGTFGFSGPWSRKMHLRRYPTELSQMPSQADFHFLSTRSALNDIVQPFLVRTALIPFATDALRARTPLLSGPNTRVSSLKASTEFEPNCYFRNGAFHELFFIQEGTGTLFSEYGSVPFKPFDYIVIPKGTTYRIELQTQPLFAMIIESVFPIEWPEHYRNQAGQLHMISPVVETEIRPPQYEAASDVSGEFVIFVQQRAGAITKTIQQHHPFDVVGWEGTLYPYAFPISSHHGITREIHTAPPAHQTFQAGQVPHYGFSLCSFVSQMEGWHPREVPVPYAHLNVDSDEVMFFSSASYGAREAILEEGMLTFHPGAVPHSPHGDAAEKSLRNRGRMSSRRAVMFDTYFESLEIFVSAEPYLDREYPLSWIRAR